ncbi:macro domain-containing protein [Salmonella enterica subsp. enterica]|nr:macro domain-containing protein [Salmonella enterica subsp. enterica]
MGDKRETKGYTSPVFRVIQGDITQLSVDAIVNAANASSLMGGGGVDGAIHRAAGPALLTPVNSSASNRANVRTGCSYHACRQAFGKGGYSHSKPVWRGGEHRAVELLKRHTGIACCLPRRINFRSIAFPAISTGVYGYPRACQCR